MSKKIVSDDGRTAKTAPDMTTIDGVRLHSIGEAEFTDLLHRCKVMYQDAEKALCELIHSAAVSALCRQDTTQAQSLCEQLATLDVGRIAQQKLAILFGGYNVTTAGKRISNPARALYIRDTESGAWLENAPRGKADWTKRREAALHEYVAMWKGRNLKQIAVSTAEKPFDLAAFAAVVKAGTTSGRAWNDLQRNDIKACISALMQIPALRELLAEETITAVSRLDGKPSKTA